MKKELLVPVGSLEHLIFAVSYGCDAVYLGGKSFGARAYAQNFSNEELLGATEYCHLYGVKIYVTVNVMVFERERKIVMEYINFLYHIGVDAVIVSDIGIIWEIHEKYPKLAIHVSTQAHTFSEAQIVMLKKMGATRVVLDRELSLEEIKALPPIIEFEVFIHGALCVCFSGRCYMSALNEVRSGNRGTCAQYCRMKYKLYQDGKLVNTNGDYLLSTKELNTSDYIKELMDSPITSFKIEGRMKSKEYVGFITKFYRSLIDSGKVDSDSKENLKTLFNREFTKGYLFNEQDIMNFATPNHKGVFIGKVISFDYKKIKIKLTQDLNQGDGIRFFNHTTGFIVNFLYNEKGLLISSAKKGEIVLVDNKVSLNKLDDVYKTLDCHLIEEINHLPDRKIPIYINVIAHLNEFKVTLGDYEKEISLSDNICEVAQKCATTKKDITSQMRLGNTPFCLDKIEIEIDDNLFIPVSKINDIRRKAVNALIDYRKNRKL